MYHKLVPAKEFRAQQSKKSNYQSDLDLDPMTMILKHDHTKMSRHSIVEALMNRQRDRQYGNITFPPTRAVNIKS